MSQGAEAWMKLCEKVSEQCHATGDVTYHSLSLLKYEPLTRAFKSCSTVLRAEHVTTVSDLVVVTVKMRGWCCEYEQVNTFRFHLLRILTITYLIQ